MASNRITEGVGKKIVEALKKQSDLEIQNVVENAASEDDTTSLNTDNQEIVYTEETNNDYADDSDTVKFSIHNEGNYTTYNEDHIINQSNNFASQNIKTSFTQPVQESFASELDNFEIPTNIAVLKQLINQLPAGVSKQTGAQIIKQTMEALGISMKSVLQEAQQVQESLNNSAKDCQASIMEYKKQINILERQAQKYQKQYSALNDIISLFIQTNN